MIRQHRLWSERLIQRKEHRACIAQAVMRMLKDKNDRTKVVIKPLPERTWGIAAARRFNGATFSLAPIDIR